MCCLLLGYSFEPWPNSQALCNASPDHVMLSPQDFLNRHYSKKCLRSLVKVIRKKVCQKNTKTIGRLMIITLIQGSSECILFTSSRYNAVDSQCL